MDITLETQLVMLTFIHICHIHMHILNCLMCIFKIKRATYLLPSHVPLCYLIDTFCCGVICLFPNMPSTQIHCQYLQPGCRLL